MTIEDIYDLMINSDIEDNLLGEILFEDNSIKYSYDGLYRSTDNMKFHLKEVFSEDIEVIKNFLKENNCKKGLEITKPEYDEAFITFQIFSDEEI